MEAKIASPRCQNIYKILEVHRKGFSVKVINVVTGAKLEILSSRLQELSLSDLEQAHFASPGLYKKLTDLTLKIRNKYQPGRQLPKGLHLLKEWPNEAIENKDPVDAVQDFEGDNLQTKHVLPLPNGMVVHVPSHTGLIAGSSASQCPSNLT